MIFKESKDGEQVKCEYIQEQNRQENSLQQMIIRKMRYNDKRANVFTELQEKNKYEQELQNKIQDETEQLINRIKRVDQQQQQQEVKYEASSQLQSLLLKNIQQLFQSKIQVIQRKLNNISNTLQTIQSQTQNIIHPTDTSSYIIQHLQQQIIPKIQISANQTYSLLNLAIQHYHQNISQQSITNQSLLLNIITQSVPTNIHFHNYEKIMKIINHIEQFENVNEQGYEYIKSNMNKLILEAQKQEGQKREQIPIIELDEQLIQYIKYSRNYEQMLKQHNNYYGYYGNEVKNKVKKSKKFDYK